MRQTTVEHRCLPRTAQPCPHCRELIDPAVYCDICGADISPHHVCAPHPLDHICPPLPAQGRCLDCGQPFSARLFCTTCGADITPLRRCPAAPPTVVYRAAPLHRCPVLPHPRCSECGDLLPALTFCAHCGMEATPVHACHSFPVQHVCPPHLTMPRHCTQCGADITPAHTCPSA